MNPNEIERARETVGLLKEVLEGIRVVKEYQLEIMASQREIREDLRNLDNLRPLRVEVPTK